jgi:hypothetical protein
MILSSAHFPLSWLAKRILSGTDTQLGHITRRETARSKPKEATTANRVVPIRCRYPLF